MSLLDKIKTDLNAAMKSRETEKVSVLRLLNSELKNKKIELGKELEDADIIDVIVREVKKRNDAASQYRELGRADLAEKEEGEVVIITQYLPKQLSTEEITKLIDDAITQTNSSIPADMGKVMGALMPKVKGKADGSLVSKMVKEKLS